MRKSFISVSLSVCLFTLLIVSTAEAAGWSGDVRVASISVVNGRVWLRFTSAPFNNLPCSDKSGQYALGGDSVKVDRITSLATKDLMNSRNVSVYWDSCSGGGSTGYPVVTGIALK